MKTEGSSASHPVYIFEESELEQAREAEARGEQVRIATTCAYCNGSIRCEIVHFDNRAHSPIVHTDSFHDMHNL